MLDPTGIIGWDVSQCTSLGGYGCPVKKMADSSDFWRNRDDGEATLAGGITGILTMILMLTAVWWKPFGQHELWAKIFLSVAAIIVTISATRVANRASTGLPGLIARLFRRKED